MSDPPKRKLVQTQISSVFLYPDVRKNLGEERSPYFSRPATSSQQTTSTQQTTSSFGELSDAGDASDTPAASRKRPTAAEKANRRKALQLIAAETKAILPNLLDTLPNAPPKGYIYSPPQPPRLDKRYCPGFSPTSIRVIDDDTFDTAIGLAKCAQYITVQDKRPVCVLNMANAYSAGGGWRNGALAQEEALCYRSSLSFTLKLRYYPLPELGAIYSPYVVIIRESLKNGHELLDLSKPEELPVVSAISVAAICDPEIVTWGSRDVYKNSADRDLMKEKMRVILRVAAVNGHRRLVLGALGCGAFMNPKEEVADCWAEVFKEQEFSGGWWESVLFAVMDDLGEGKDGNGNFGIFHRKLEGMLV
ncbi:hypothetical protein FQN54_005742 [Arachnomyces sp. PD_36]|nr:hypothetical protein FQN54_005742 [Arachnomyces sp. PD_36]